MSIRTLYLASVEIENTKVILKQSASRLIVSDGRCLRKTKGTEKRLFLYSNSTLLHNGLGNPH